jgi:hypothetical protein
MARRLLAMPAANPVATQDAAACMQRVARIDIQRCPHCGSGRWRCVETVLPDSAALAAIAAGCRGPP